MTDYGKLTVAKLKDELDRRGLPKSGLKAVLVKRLVDADVDGDGDGEEKGKDEGRVHVGGGDGAVRQEGGGDGGEGGGAGEGGEAEGAGEKLDGVNAGATKEVNAERAGRANEGAGEGNVGDGAASGGAVLEGEGGGGGVEGDGDGRDGGAKADGAKGNGADAGGAKAEEALLGVENGGDGGKGDGVKDDGANGDGAEAGGPKADESTEKAEKPAERIEEGIQDQLAADDSSRLVQETPKDKAKAPSISHDTLAPIPAPSDSQPDHQDHEMISMVEAELPTPGQTQSQLSTYYPSVSTQASITNEEMLEDSKKRKRRSQSPPPSSFGSTKRFKGVIDRPKVELPEDTEMQTQGPASVSPADTIINGRQDGRDESVRKPSREDATDSTDQQAQVSISNASTLPTTEDSSSKAVESPSKPDTRFKSLFTGPPQPPSPPSARTPDHLPAPSIHPATPALYIRNLMRPLNPTTLKSHLTSLAQLPSDTKLDADTPAEMETLTHFHLAAIRTHCLARFSTTAAAARVRSALHDRVWPQERDRKPLWIDFVPEEKVEKWISVETDSATSSRGSGTKRWEVVYETVDDEGEEQVQAYLQEVIPGSSTRPPRLQQQQHAPIASSQLHASIEADHPIPSADQAQPKNKSAETPAFRALDDLFKSTTTKPKLYYLPVTKSIAERRLDILDSFRGDGRGGRGDEMMRYSFEDESLVSRGPEFGRGGGRGRGPSGGGGGGGGYRGRGGWRRGGGDGRDGRRGGW